MLSNARVSTLVPVLAAALALAGAAPVRAHVELGGTLDTSQETPPTSFTTTLDSTQETPAPTVGGHTPTGTATFTLNADHTITYTFATQDLTGPAILAHIHQGAPGVAGGIVVALNQTTGTGTTTALTDAQVDALHAGNLYINVHTGTNPGGEIRGQIHQPNATATFAFDPETGKLDYTVTPQNLTGAVTMAHLHIGPPGVSGMPTITLDNSLTGSVSNLTEQQVNDLYDGKLYVNVHTAAHGAGEIRAQVTITGKSACDCTNATHKAFLKCVADEIKKLAKANRKLASVRAIKQAAKVSSCGLTKGSKKAIACCLPQTPTENIVVGRLCAPIADKACTRKKGTPAAGGSCFPTNPCTPAAD